MRNKKLLAVSLLVALTFSACGKSNQGESTPTVTPIVESEVQDSESLEVSDDANANEDIIGDENEVIADDEIFEETPLVSNEILDELHAAVMEKLGDDYGANQTIDATYLEEVQGINSDWYDAAIATGSMMRGQVDTFIAIHATEGNLENVYSALNSYRDYLIEEKRQYPMNLPKVQGSVVDKVGDYVIFSVLGFVDEMNYEYTEENEEEITTEIIAAYQEINESIIETAKEIINK